MKFDKCIGDKEKYKKEIENVEERLTILFGELALNYTSVAYGSRIGGDVVIYQLIYANPHIADLRHYVIAEKEAYLDALIKEKKISEDDKDIVISDIEKSLGGNILYTAATSGKEFFWSPKFISELSDVGIRLVIGHEAWHSLYMHPARRGTRVPLLWNISVDFKVNFTLMDDLRLRGFRNYEKLFKENLGDYVKIEEYASYLRDPFHPPLKLAHWNPIYSLKSKLDPGYQKPRATEKPLYFAESALSKELRRPENIYDYLVNQVPRCKDCKKQPAYNYPPEYLKLKKELKRKKELEAKNG